MNSKEVKIQSKYLLKDNDAYNNIITEYDITKGSLIKADKSDKETINALKEKLSNLKASIDRYKYDATMKALEYFNYPASFDEFRSKYESQILDNVSKFNKGDISGITPITVEEANNHLLDIEKVFVNNSANNSIAETPASDDAAKKFMRDFYDIIEDPLVAVDYSTPQAVIKASNANAIGQQNIGIAALANVMFQYFKDNNTNIKDLGAIDSYVANGVRINDLISTVITMAVDNAKEQYAIRFNLTPATQSVFVSMLMLKNDFKFVSALMVQPVLVEYAALESFKKSPIKNKKEEDEIGDNLIELIAEYEGAKSVYDFFPEGVNYDILKKAKLYKQKIDNGQELGPNDLTEEQYRSVQSYTINTFYEYNDKTKSLFHFSRVISLIKGLSSSIGEGIEGIQTSLEALGIEVKENKNGGLYLDYTNDYKEAVSDPEDTTYPIDYLKIINGNSFLKSEVLSFYRVNKLLPKFFLSRTPLAMEIYDDVVNNIKFLKTEDAEKLTRLVNGYLSIMSYTHKYDPEKKFIKFSDLISTDESNSELIEMLRKLKKDSDPLISKNEFIRFLDYDKIAYSGKDKNSLNDKTTYTLKVDSFAKLTPSESRKLTNSFQQLFTSENPLAKEFARKTLFHILGKDLGMYRSNSYISLIPPQVLRPFINQIDVVQSELLSASPNYKGLFGMTKDQLIEDFTEKYIRDINNTMSIKGGKRGNIGRNTKLAMRNAYYKLSDKDKLIVSKDEFLAPLLNKIAESKEFTKEDYDQFSPIQWTEDGFEINIFKNFFTENGQLKHPTIVRFNKNVLKRIGLFSYEIVEKDGKYYSNIVFPKGLNILEDKSKDLYFRTELVKGKSTVSVNPNAGVRATYKKVKTLGSKFILPYAFPISDQVKEVVKSGEREYTPEDIKSLKPNEVFVFGANTAGGHGGGTAGLAQRGTSSPNYVALPVGTKGKWSEYGVVDKLMQGKEGKSFGIVTKAATISGTSLKVGPKRSVPLSRIEQSINALIKTANENPNLKFLVTKFGTNMAGFSQDEMKSLLENKDLPDNIILPKEFEVRTGKTTLSKTPGATLPVKPGLQPRGTAAPIVKQTAVKQTTFKPNTKEYYKSLAKNGVKFQITVDNQPFDFIVNIGKSNIGGKVVNRYVDYAESVTSGGQLSIGKTKMNAYTIASSIVETFLNIENENFNEVVNDLKDLKFSEITIVSQEPAGVETKKGKWERSKPFYMSIKDKLEANGITSYEEYSAWAETISDDVLTEAIKCL
jgi:hypothetical protein